MSLIDLTLVQSDNSSFEETERLIREEMGRLWAEQPEFKMSLDYFKDEAERNILGFTAKEYDEALKDYYTDQSAASKGEYFD